MRIAITCLSLLALTCAAQARGVSTDTEKATTRGPSRAVGEDTDTFPTVPGADIFGTTQTTDVGDPGDLTLTSENNGRVGKSRGSFFSLTSKNQLGYTLTDRFWTGVALFATGTSLRNIPDIGPNRDRADFDGASVEFQYLVLPRSASNPFQVSFDVEAGFARLDPYTAGYNTSFYVTPQIFVDAVVVPDKLFWGLNVGYSPNAEHFTTGYSGSAQVNVSTSLAYQYSPDLFFGVEARYFDSFNDAQARKFGGDALFIGPTIFYKVNEHLTVNATYSPQVAGHQKGQAITPGLINLNQYERQNFRLKIAYEF